MAVLGKRGGLRFVGLVADVRLEEGDFFRGFLLVEISFEVGGGEGAQLVIIGVVVGLEAMTPFEIGRGALRVGEEGVQIGVVPNLVLERNGADVETALIGEIAETGFLEKGVERGEIGGDGRLRQRGRRGQNVWRDE